MRRKEPVLDTVLADLPDWVLGLTDPPELPPVPPMDPAFGFPEAWWVRVCNHAAAGELRRAWLAKHAPNVSNRLVWAEAQRRRTNSITERTAP